MLRAVIDTNVFLSALLRGRGTRPILDALIARRFKLIISSLLLEELVEVLSRPEWLRALAVQDRRELLTVIHEAAGLIQPAQRISVCRDPEDNALLECALGNADCLVTGDNDLLVLNPFRGLQIIRPAEFLKLLP